MKKNMFKVAFVVAIALVCGINVFEVQKSEALSEIALSNVQALADLKPTYTGLIYLKGEYGTGGCINCAEPKATNCTCR
jgi:hypothetical protein